jgi:hypothetical protein
MLETVSHHSTQSSLQSRQKPLLIYAASNFYHAVDSQSPEQPLPQLKPILQQVCGKKIRRIDRFTQLALIGAFPCRPPQGLPTSTGVYMSSSYGAVNNTSKVLSEIYQQGQLPKPLNFINTVSNTACFYLSEQLALSASNQFVTSESFTLEAGLNIASIDLELGNITAALVGQVCEVDSNLDIHRQRLQLPPSMGLAEGSHWLLVAHQLAGQQALAEITLLKAPLSESELNSQLSALSVPAGLATEVSFADAIDAVQRACIVTAAGATEVQYAPVDLRHEYHTALQVQGFLAAGNSAERFICIDKNKRGYYSMIVIEKRR